MSASDYYKAKFLEVAQQLGYTIVEKESQEAHYDLFVKDQKVKGYIKTVITPIGNSKSWDIPEDVFALAEKRKHPMTQ